MSTNKLIFALIGCASIIAFAINPEAMGIWMLLGWGGVGFWFVGRTLMKGLAYGGKKVWNMPRREYILASIVGAIVLIAGLAAGISSLNTDEPEQESTFDEEVSDEPFDWDAWEKSQGR